MIGRVEVVGAKEGYLCSYTCIAASLDDALLESAVFQ